MHSISQGLRRAVAFAFFGILVSASAAGAATFPANGGTLGAIPDGTAAGPEAYGAPRNVTFTVSGMTGPLTSLSLGINATHTWLGDLDVVLTSPGGVRSLVVFSRTGATSAGSAGDSSDLSSGNNLVFADTASTNWWTAANVATSVTPMPADSYRTTLAGPQAIPAAATSLDTAFAGLSTAQMNGTWTLAFRDGASSDTGSVTAASLTLAGVAGLSHTHADFTGDGRTDYSIARDTGGTIFWWTADAASLALSLNVFGASATDFVVSGDFDGDGKADVAVWRPGAAGVAGFWILRSSDGAATFTPFGQTSDDPTVVADYDGDGKTDLAVYRKGANPGDQSTWWYLSSLTGTLAAVPWGVNGDFPAPGDYDGDGKADFAVQRDSGGQGVFWIAQSGGGTAVVPWGLGSDIIVPGDYDGDGKTDLAVSRNVAGARQYWIRRSSDGGLTFTTWGITGDVRCPGDYDGDGKTDFAIWRPSATPGQSRFWVLRSSNGAVIQLAWGQASDYPVASFIVH